MRVVVVANSEKIGGGNRSLLGLADSLRARGHAVAVTSPADGPLVGECRRVEVPCDVLDYHQPSWREPRRTYQTLREWRSYLKQSAAELTHANSPEAARCLCLASKLNRLPIICHVRFGLGTKIARWLFRGLPKPHTFIFNSKALQGEVGPCLEKACPQTKQEVVYNSVDLKAFVPSKRQAHGPTRVGIVANLMPVKGHGDFLEMAAILRQQGVEAEFVLIGADIHGTGYRGELETRAHELGICERVRFAGHCSDMPAAFRELDIVVCSSHHEPFGRCLIEAMACGKPVVGTRVGGIPEVVEDGVSGVLVSPHRPDELAKAVRTIIEDRKLYERFAHAGRRRAEALFGHERHVDEILRIYNQVLGK